VIWAEVALAYSLGLGEGRSASLQGVGELLLSGLELSRETQFGWSVAAFCHLVFSNLEVAHCIVEVRHQQHLEPLEECHVLFQSLYSLLVHLFKQVWFDQAVRLLCGVHR
jgi:hypothetical protein